MGKTFQIGSFEDLHLDGEDFSNFLRGSVLIKCKKNESCEYSLNITNNTHQLNEQVMEIVQNHCSTEKGYKTCGQYKEDKVE